MKSPALSIVIPTHKRADILRQCLKHIEKQTIANQLEVIVVSDGPDPETAKLFKNTANYSLQTTHYIDIPKSQQGVARNRGVEKVTAPIVMFIGDDILLEPTACEVHVKTHESWVTSFGNAAAQELMTHSPRPIAVLGFTTWDPSLEINSTMKWLEKTGWQFGYPLIQEFAHQQIPTDLQHRFTYTSNISVPTEIAKKFPFNEEVTLYGWEDILWGQQLRDAGIPLVYEPDAKAFHHHRVEMEDSLKRMKTLGRSLRIIEPIAPQLDRRPTGLKLLAYKLIALTPTMRGKHYKAFLDGLSEE